MKFYVSTDWSDGVPRSVGCFTTNDGKRLERGELEQMGRLFLAAPEMLDALRLARDDLSTTEVLNKVNAVIAKAEGRDE